MLRKKKIISVLIVPRKRQAYAEKMTKQKLFTQHIQSEEESINPPDVLYYEAPKDVSFHSSVGGENSTPTCVGVIHVSFFSPCTVSRRENDGDDKESYFRLEMLQIYLLH